MGATVKGEVDDREVVDVFRRLIAAGRNPAGLLQAFGRYGKTSTQLRFRTQTDPDGRAWKPSKRVGKHGGQTLRLTSRLLNSLAWQLIEGGVEWGSNVAYAAAHQFGVDDPKQQVRAHFRIAGKNRQHVALKAQAVKSFTRHMVIPPRRFLGINQDDRRALVGIAKKYLEGTAGRPLSD